MNCPGSVKMTAHLPNSTSVFAAQGTAAHDRAERLLTGKPVQNVGDVVKVEGFEIEIDEEMVECVDEYVAYVRKLAGNIGEIKVEQRLSLEEIHPGMFGTADAVVLKGPHMHVVDLKYGQGVKVNAEGNSQGQYYALGAYLALDRNQRADLDQITIHIYQPRAGGVTAWSIDPADLVEWSWVLQDMAERTANPDAELIAGRWCRFCPALPACPAVQEQVNHAAQSDFEEPAEMDGYALAAALENAELIDNWISAVRKHAYEIAMKGESIPGYKLVMKRAQRKWIDEGDAATALCGLGGDVDDIFVKKLISPAQAEKLIGKKPFEHMSSHVSKESSGTTLVRQEDRRPAVTPPTAQSLFEGEV